MTLRARTPEDPPPVDYRALKDELDQLTSICDGIYHDTRYLPHERGIDEAYKAARALIDMSHVRRTVRLATELAEAVHTLRESFAWVVER